jgi:hypothetical protein
MIDPFVGAEGFDFLLAAGNPDALFEVGRETLSRLRALDSGGISYEEQKGLFVEGRFGKGLKLSWKHVEIALPGASPLPGEEVKEVDAPKPPREKGTIEFWMKPLWSATDFEHERSTHRFKIFDFAPFMFHYSIDPDNSGRTGRYNISFSDFRIAGAGYTRARIYLQRGKWYHFATTWNIDGKSNHIRMFINGRRKSYFHYKVGLAPDTTPDKIGAVASAIRFGSGHYYGRGASGEVFDELRISTVVRYENDFNPSKEPHERDENTYLLMHLDEELDVKLGQTELKAKVKAGGRF